MSYWLTRLVNELVGVDGSGSRLWLMFQTRAVTTGPSCYRLVTSWGEGKSLCTIGAGAGEHCDVSVMSQEWLDSDSTHRKRETPDLHIPPPRVTAMKEVQTRRHRTARFWQDLNWLDSRVVYSVNPVSVVFLSIDPLMVLLLFERWS